MKRIAWNRLGFVGRAVPACLLACLIGASAGAQPRPPERPGTPQRTVAGAAVEAHRQIDSAAISVRFSPYFSYPDETEFLTVQYRAVFDRKGERLRIDRPGYTLVCDGTDFLLVADDLPGRHLRVALDGPLTYERLVAFFPDLNDPMPPALILLLADDPMDWLSGGAADDATPFVPKPQGARRTKGMRFPTGLGEAELLRDAKTGYISDLQIKVDDQQLVGSGLDAVRFHYEVAWSSVNEPVDEELFALDLKGSTEAATLAQFLAAPAQPGHGAGGTPGGAGGDGGSLIGQSLPDIELALLGGDEKVKLSDLDKGVVVVEFFASWTRPSVLDLPALVDFRAWCDKEKHEAAVYAVAVGETQESMSKWLDALEKTADRKVDLPVLLDTSTDAAVKLGLPTVPRTLVVVDGKIVEVFGGMKPEFLGDLKKGLPGWLEKVEPEQEEQEQENEAD